MNYFAHALELLDRPYCMAGAAVPDWLMVADRTLRLRSKHARLYVHDADPIVAEVAEGVLRHLEADAQFHATRAFVEISLEITVLAREALDEESGPRPAFLGHLLAEMLLDAALIAEQPERLTEYYRLLDGLDAELVQSAVNRMAPRPTLRLAPFIELFRRERVLWDYQADDKLMRRLGQIMRRVGLPQLPDQFAAILPAARKLVAGRKRELVASG